MEKSVSQFSGVLEKLCFTDLRLARLVLNYKGIPYTTEWIDLADIAPRLESYGVKPNPPETAGAAVGVRYTLPAMKLSDKTFIMDSVKIVTYLESQYPEPTLRLDEGLYEDAQALVFKTAVPLFSEYMPCIRDNLITKHSLPYWKKSREGLFGMPIDEFQKKKGGEKAWEAAEPGLLELTTFLSESKRDDGPYILGSQITYADLVLVAFLESSRRTSEEIFKRVIGFHENIESLYEACSKWLERSSY
jgi:glutathione S-transferase